MTRLFDQMVWDYKYGKWLAFCPANRNGIIVNEQGKVLLGRLVDHLKNGGLTLDELKVLIQEKRLNEPFWEELQQSGLLDEPQDDDSPAHCDVSNASPLFVYMHLTHACNLKCRYCYNIGLRTGSMANPQMSAAEYGILFEELSKAGVKHIIFTGGEALTRKDFMEIVALAVASGIPCSLITNGTLVNEENAGRLAELLSMINISIDCVEPEVNDYYRGKGSFDKVINGIECLAKIAPHKIRLKAVVTNRNIKSLNKYYGFFKNKYGINKMRFSPICADSLDQCDDDDMTLSWENHLLLDKVVDEMIDQRYEDVVDKCLWGAMCGAGIDMVSISPEGDLYPCQSFHFPELETANVREMGFMRAFQESKVLQEMRNLTVEDIDHCKDCNIKFICASGCRAFAFKLYRNMYAHNQAFCQYYRREAINLIWHEAANQQHRYEGQDKTSYSV